VLEIKPTEPLALAYKSRLEACLPRNRQIRPDCAFNPTPANLGQQFQTVFPILPLYDCQQYPVLRLNSTKDHLPLCN